MQSRPPPCLIQSKIIMYKPSWHLFPWPGLTTCSTPCSYIRWKCMKGGVDTHGRQGGLLFSSASSKGYVVSSLDISNAYFQGEEMDRLLILKPPKGNGPGGTVRRWFYLMAPSTRLRDSRCRKKIMETTPEVPRRKRTSGEFQFPFSV